jgi:hypothetical protein
MLPAGPLGFFPVTRAPLARAPDNTAKPPGLCRAENTGKDRVRFRSIEAPPFRPHCGVQIQLIYVKAALMFDYIDTEVHPNRRVASRVMPVAEEAGVLTQSPGGMDDGPAGLADGESITLAFEELEEIKYDDRESDRQF